MYITDTWLCILVTNADFTFKRNKTNQYFFATKTNRYFFDRLCLYNSAGCAFDNPCHERGTCNELPGNTHQDHRCDCPMGWEASPTCHGSAYGINAFLLLLCVPWSQLEGSSEEGFETKLFFVWYTSCVHVVFIKYSRVHIEIIETCLTINY